MGTKVEEVAEEYADLATRWAQQWGAFVTGAAGKVGGGSYDTSAANADFATGARLVAQGWMDLAGTALDSLAILTGDEDEPYIVSSGPYPVPPAPATASGTRTLRLAGPLVAALGDDELPVAAVRFDPQPLDSTHDTFVLVVDATGHDGSTYYGSVIVEAASTPVAVEVTVA